MSNAREATREAWQDMIRLRVRGTLESIGAEEGLSEPVARVRFVQFVIQGGTRTNMRIWKHRAQSLQEAGEEALERFLDGRWQRPAGGGASYFTRSQNDWVVALWEVGCAEWERERSKPKQLPLGEQPPELFYWQQLERAYHYQDWNIVLKVEEKLKEKGI